MTPDLSKPYSTRQEREDTREAIVLYWRLIELLMSLSDLPVDQWVAGRKRLFPSPAHGGPSEHPLQRLERWLSLYSDEIQVLREVRNRVVHADNVDDPELRGAEWIARVIIATLFSKMPSETDKSWARMKTEEVLREITVT